MPFFVIAKDNTGRNSPLLLMVFFQGCAADNRENKGGKKEGNRDSMHICDIMVSTNMHNPLAQNDDLL